MDLPRYSPESINVDTDVPKKPPKSVELIGLLFPQVLDSWYDEQEKELRKKMDERMIRHWNYQLEKTLPKTLPKIPPGGVGYESRKSLDSYILNNKGPR